jgi:hypothetical protein
MAAEVDDDLQLMRASAGLLSDLQLALQKLLWKRENIHHLVRSRDLDHVIQLIEPFQGDPQLLDAHLKTLLPPIVEAYLAFLQVPQAKPPSSITVALDVAASKLLYTFCKVRGEKIIIGFLNNEPRYCLGEVVYLASMADSLDAGALRPQFDIWSCSAFGRSRAYVFATTGTFDRTTCNNVRYPLPRKRYPGTGCCC